jgi:hypothetical protein
MNNPDNQYIKETKKVIGLNVSQWGYVSTVTNGISVIVQLYTLFNSFSAQSFSMEFIWLMTLLNFVYFLVAILDGNIGFALATFFFVAYNLCVVGVHHCGLGGSKINSWFHSKITKVCKPMS